jgi:hypothetical protein
MATANVSQAALVVGYTVSDPSAVVPDIAGPPEVEVTFDGSASLGTHYNWTWTSVPEASSIVNAKIPFPDSKATTPMNMSGNVLLLHMEGNATDTSGQGNNGTVTGATLVTGTVGAQAYEFDGASDHIEITGTNIFPGTTNAITISLWQYGDASQPRMDGIFEAYDASDRRVLNSHLPWSTGQVYWDCGNSNSTSYDRINKGAATADYEGQWNHWVFTKDVAAGEMKIYLNGAEWHSGTSLTRTLDPISKMKIGGVYYDATGNSDYAGKIDEFAVWARVLSATEIADIYHMQSTVGAGPPLATLAFTPDVAGTYTVQLAVHALGGATTADAVIAAVSGPDGISKIINISKDDIGSIMGITYGDIDKINDID